MMEGYIIRDEGERNLGREVAVGVCDGVGVRGGLCRENDDGMTEYGRIQWRDQA